MIAQSGTINNKVGHQPPIRYSALVSAMAQVAKFAKQKAVSISCPKFGCGLAGGNWDVIKALIIELWVPVVSNVNIYHL